jgi:peptide-methionine (R)-S-oxide reductase
MKNNLISNLMKKQLILLAIVIVPVIFACTDAKPTGDKVVSTNADTIITKVQLEAPDYVWDGKKINKTEGDWKKQLTELQFYVARQAGTERAFSNPYHDNHEEGTYYCVGCGMPLFDSKHKFDSGTGWPSYYQPIQDKNVAFNVDYDIGYERKEVHCARCESHLGHVFDDAYEQPGGLRYCINSASLIFEKR